MLPELPDARMDTRKPIGPPQIKSNQTFGMICPTRMPNKIKMNYYQMRGTGRNGRPTESEERAQQCCAPTKKNQ
jgi:hypothetical protein